jgi:peptidoglycan/LPS O-acetylase OafA/YrhL
MVHMARTATRNSPSNTRRTSRPRLSQRGVLVVAVIVGGLVVAARNGYAGPAALAGYGLYLLLSGKAAAAARVLPSGRQVLRALCWTAVAGAAIIAAQGTTAPGGSTFGLALAAALAVALKLTATRTRRTGRNAH